jgi:RNA polymerase sigma-70 factor (ECF subfamily)
MMAEGLVRMNSPSSNPLAPAFLRAVGAAASSWESLPELEATLAELHARGRAEWPRVELAAEAYADWLGHRAPARASLEALRALSSHELYLTCACASANAAALELFQARYLRPVVAHATRGDGTPAFSDEVTQVLSTHLFTPDEGGRAPRIADYRGQGSLHAWLRLAAARLVMNLKRGLVHRTESMESAQHLPMTGPDPELGLLQAQHRDAFSRAFEHALSSLSVEQRNALRLHYLDGLTLEQVGRLLGMSKASVSRWLKDARTAILDEARRDLKSSLGVDSAEVDSLLDKLQSQWDVSVSRLLRAPTPPPPEGS